MNKENIYLNLPHFFKDMAVSLFSYKSKLLRKGGNYIKYLELFKKSAFWNKNKIEEYQKNELKKLLLEVNKYSKYYKKEFQSLGITDEDISKDPVRALKRMNFLEKNTLKTKLSEIENLNPSRKRDFTNFTSGTTGTPTVTYYDNDSLQKTTAFLNRYFYLNGLTKTKYKQIRLSGKIIVKPNKKKAPFWVYNSVDKQLFISTYHLTEENLASIVKKIDTFKPELIEGYPSAIYIISKYINENNIKLSFIPKLISTTAETLYERYVIEIEKAFKRKPLNQYSSSEGGVYITECPKGKFHLNYESGFFEFFNVNGEVAKRGEMAELVATTFRSYKTPLIRYKTGDWVKLSNEENYQCSCGMKTPIVDQIIGRQDDILYTEEKGFVGRMDTAYKGLEGIEKSQIIQKTPDLIIINQIIDTSVYDEKMNDKFIKNLRERLGEEIQININIVDEIPLGANGKFNAVKRMFSFEDI